MSQFYSVEAVASAKQNHHFGSNGQIGCGWEWLSRCNLTLDIILKFMFFCLIVGEL